MTDRSDLAFRAASEVIGAAIGAVLTVSVAWFKSR